MPDATELNELYARVKILSERLWEQHARRPEIDAWLANFSGRVMDVDVERHYALHLLSHLNYYGLRELRVLLRTVYRDLFRYPLIQSIRHSMGSARDSDEVDRTYRRELNSTRFLGMGNPAESGTHLLYYFRQENSLPKNLFITPTQIFDGPLSDQSTKFSSPTLKRLVFLDDLLGSGQQSSEYSRTLLADVNRVASRTGQKVTADYYVLFAKTDALKRARATAFDHVASVHEMDESYVTFGPQSRVYNPSEPGIDSDVACQICTAYGSELWPAHPLGYRGGQMLLAFHHNVPDNTLPIIWWDEPDDRWEPVLSRYPKVLA